MRHPPRPLSALQILLHRLRITSCQSTSPDVHFDEHWQLFLQFEDDRAFGKNVTTPVDARNQIAVAPSFTAFCWERSVSAPSSAP